MDEDHAIIDVDVDRLEEMVTTQLPGYALTEHVVHDVAAERRMELALLYRFLWSILSLLEILLAIRFLLRLIGANPAREFAIFLYGVSGLFASPFFGLVPTPSLGGGLFEVTTLIAMAIYALTFWIIAYVIWLITSLPAARAFSRTVRAQSKRGNGVVQTTHTTISNKKV